jgi:predicted signal transduction protein with EAL and GGDEF domain
MPCTELKIDRGFVSGASVQEERNVLLRNSVNIGHGLGLNVVAEGVETRADWEAVASSGADEAQGWYVGKAQPEDKIEAWMHDWASRVSLLARKASQAGQDQIAPSTEWSIQGIWGRLSTTQWITTIGLMALSALVARLI